MIKNTNIIKNKMLSYEDIQERLDVLKDSYKGEKCYIVGAGPSLKNYDVDYVKDKLKDNLVDFKNETGFIEKLSPRQVKELIMEITPKLNRGGLMTR